MYDEGLLQLTTHRIIWDDASSEVWCRFVGLRNVAHATCVDFTGEHGFRGSRAYH